MPFFSIFQPPTPQNGPNILEYAVLMIFILIFTSFGYIVGKEFIIFHYFLALTTAPSKIAYFELLGVPYGAPYLPTELGTQFHV